MANCEASPELVVFCVKFPSLNSSFICACSDVVRRMKQKAINIFMSIFLAKLNMFFSIYILLNICSRLWSVCMLFYFYLIDRLA